MVVKALWDIKLSRVEREIKVLRAVSGIPNVV